MGDDGRTFYSFSSNGAGFSTGTGGCGDGAEVMSKAAGSAIQQVTDNLAQTLNSAVQVRDYVKSSSH